LSSQKDGYGAQIQRILSVKSLANSVHQSFMFNPLTEVEDQVTQKTLSPEAKNEEISQFNSWLGDILDSRGEIINGFQKIIQINSAFTLFRQSLFYFLLRKTKSFRIKFRLENAYFMTNINPDLYLTIAAPMNRVESNFSKKQEIHVHVRFVNFAIGTYRYLDSKYYLHTLDRVTSKLDNVKIDYRIILHSDFDGPFGDLKNKSITPMTKNHLFEMRLIDSEDILDKNILEAAFDLLKAIHGRYRNVEFSKSETPLNSLESMISADFLVLSKSSFAFVAGILNRRAEIYSPEYWINLPTSWNTKSGF
jgi:hypothetical protein